MKLMLAIAFIKAKKRTLLIAKVYMGKSSVQSECDSKTQNGSLPKYECKFDTGIRYLFNNPLFSSSFFLVFFFFSPHLFGAHIFSPFKEGKGGYIFFLEKTFFIHNYINSTAKIYVV